MAMGILQGLLQGEKIQHVQVLSSGLSPTMAGKVFHKEAVLACNARGLSLVGSARLTTIEMLESSDLILPVDKSVMHELFGLDPKGKTHGKIRLLTEFLEPQHPFHGLDVSDPILGGPEDFAECFHLLEECCLFLLDEWEAEGKI
jgi:protein-tyrosine-phosphatase